MLDSEKLRFNPIAKSQKTRCLAWQGRPQIVYIDINIDHQNAHPEQFRFFHFGNFRKIPA
jgi:hypothetical protein